MATVFTVKTPIQTTASFVDVQNNLLAGTHTFQLVVVDEAGNRSNPATAQVTVLGTLIPNPPVGPVGPVNPVGPVVNPVLNPVVTPVGGPVSPVVNPVVTPGPVVRPVRIPTEPIE